MDNVPPGYVIVGRAGAPHGVSGDLKVAPFVDNPQRFDRGREVTVAGQRRAIERCRWQKGLAYLKLSGINDRESAAELRDQLLLVPESELGALAEGQYYRFQLVGLRVRTEAGEPLGQVADVLDTGANDVYIVRGPRGEVLVPATEEVIKHIDLEDGVMVVEEVPGLIPDRRPEG